MTDSQFSRHALLAWRLLLRRRNNWCPQQQNDLLFLSEKLLAGCLGCGKDLVKTLVAAQIIPARIETEVDLCADWDERCEEARIDDIIQDRKVTPVSGEKWPHSECHSERSEESLAISASVSAAINQRCFASLNMTAPLGT